MVARMDREIENLNDRQAVEMENKIEQLDVSTTSEVIPNLLPIRNENIIYVILYFVGHQQPTLSAIFNAKFGSSTMGIRIRST